MKVGAPDSIRITGKSGAFQLFKGLGVGSQVEARIVERSGLKEAVLEVTGTRIRAEFLKGVPGNDRLILRLDEKGNNSFVFRIIDSASRKDFLEKILEYSILKNEDIQKSNSADIIRLINRNPSALFELHAYLLNIHEKKEKREGLTSLLNRLLTAGINGDYLRDLSYIITSQWAYTIVPMLLMALFNEEGYKGGKGFKKEDLEKSIAGFLADLDTMQDVSVKNDTVLLLLNYLISGDDGKIEYGEIPFYIEREFRPVKCIRSGDSIFLNCEFSSLGTIDILVREYDRLISVMIIAESEESVKELEKALPDFYDRINQDGLKVVVNIFNRNIIIDKILEIISYYSLNSAFDIKV